MDSLIKQESSDIFSDTRNLGFKKVRSYDVLKTDEIGKNCLKYLYNNIFREIK